MPLFSVPTTMKTVSYTCIVMLILSIMPLLLMHTFNVFIVLSFVKEIKPLENNEKFPEVLNFSF